MLGAPLQSSLRYSTGPPNLNRQRLQRRRVGRVNPQYRTLPRGRDDLADIRIGSDGSFQRPNRRCSTATSGGLRRTHEWAAERSHEAPGQMGFWFRSVYGNPHGRRIGGGGEFRPQMGADGGRC